MFGGVENQKIEHCEDDYTVSYILSDGKVRYSKSTSHGCIPNPTQGIVSFIPHELVQSCPSHIIEETLNKLINIDHLSHWYYRANAIWSFSRDYLNALPVCELKMELPKDDLIRAGLYACRPIDSDWSLAVPIYIKKYQTFFQTRITLANTIQAYYRAMRSEKLVMDLLADAEKIIRWSSISFQDLLVSTVLQDEVTLKFPPSIKYQAVFLDVLISELETRGSEIHDTLLNLKTSLLIKYGMRVFNGFFNDPDHQTCFRTIDISPLRKKELLTIEHNIIDLSGGTTGLSIWPSAYLLSEFVASRSELLFAKRCLELGSGVGLSASIIAKTAKPASFTATDVHSEVLELLSKNLNRNCSGNFSAMELDWTDYKDDWLINQDFQVILGADIIFCPKTFKSLCQLIREVLYNSESVAFVVAHVRNLETFEKFEDQLAIAGLKAETISLEEIPKVLHYSREDLRLLKITKNHIDVLSLYDYD